MPGIVVCGLWCRGGEGGEGGSRGGPSRVGNHDPRTGNLPDSTLCTVWLGHRECRGDCQGSDRDVRNDPEQSRLQDLFSQRGLRRTQPVQETETGRANLEPAAGSRKQNRQARGVGGGVDDRKRRRARKLGQVFAVFEKVGPGLVQGSVRRRAPVRARCLWGTGPGRHQLRPVLSARQAPAQVHGRTGRDSRATPDVCRRGNRPAGGRCRSVDGGYFDGGDRGVSRKIGLGSSRSSVKSEGESEGGRHCCSQKTNIGTRGRGGEKGRPL
mmetsp:Transcript_23574/g.65416  ORF Transcript_23574/g.65416 Transcript_23574/m.65416 type:complete len:269 (+) Transcript_23574:823-1629(+)